MSGLCNTCPKPTAITDISAFDCPEDWGQIQKAVLQRKGYEFPTVSGAGGIDELASWTPLLIAADDTKAQVTPFFVEGAVAPGAAITEGGGDNTTLNGVEELVGVNPSVFSAMFKSVPQSVIKELKDYRCEDLQVYFLNENKKIIARDVDGTKVSGFPIQSFFVGDKQNDGFGTKDRNGMSFSLLKDWSDDAIVVTPSDFNPLADL